MPNPVLIATWSLLEWNAADLSQAWKIVFQGNLHLKTMIGSSYEQCYVVAIFEAMI